MGNRLLSSANTAKVREAFRKLDCFVYTGLFPEEIRYLARGVEPIDDAHIFADLGGPATASTSR